MPQTAGRSVSHFMPPHTGALLLLILCVGPLLTGGCATTETQQAGPADISLLEKWSGDYPVSELGKLPEGQQDTAAGYIGDPETFIPVWRAFMPTEILPGIDFSKNLVVFSRNTQFYNRTAIFKVTLQDGTAEILAMETMSAIPIEDKVAMAMAVIPRDGIMAIRSGGDTIAVSP